MITMAPQTSLTPGDPVKQFSVFTANQVGRLHELTALFKVNDVHVMAITVLDSADSAIVRIVVDDPDRARELMIGNDFPFSEAELLVVEIDDESKLTAVLAALLEAEVNIHYIYSFIKRPRGKAALALSVEDPEVAAQSVAQRGFKILGQADIAR